MMEKFDLTERTALVTGGASGLGRGMAIGMSSAGAHVVLVDVAESVHRTAKEIAAQTGNPVNSIVANLADRADLKRSFEEAMKKLGGKLTILVNCAGVAFAAPVESYPMDKWDLTLEINLTACYELCQLAAPIMRAQKYGKIINIASMLSFFGGTGSSSYAVSKGGIMQMTKALSNELAPDGINVNAIAPGYMMTQLNAFILENEERVKLISSRIPKGRWGQAEDVMGPAVFLASAASDYVTGVILPVDGGYLVK